MLYVTETISIPENELTFQFVRASGPGGQNVNKVATAAKLRFDAEHSPSLPEEVRQRLLENNKSRINSDGILTIDARRYRSQERNRQDAMDRLAELIREASEKPKPRVATQKPVSIDRKRIESKRKRGATKRLRKPLSPSDDE